MPGEAIIPDEEDFQSKIDALKAAYPDDELDDDLLMFEGELTGSTDELPCLPDRPLEAELEARVDTPAEEAPCVGTREDVRDLIGPSQDEQEK